MSLIDDLIYQSYLKTPRIIDAFRKIKRVDFVTEEMKYLAEVDGALPTAKGQTISQPAVVAFMLELLQPEEGDKILDVGSGSGWTTALLATLVSQDVTNLETRPEPAKGAYPEPVEELKPEGKVIAIEVIPELMKFGKNNVAKYNFIEKGIVEFICADGSKGCPNVTARPELAGGFDKILVSAAAQRECPKALKEQVKISGRIVIPIENSIWLFVKKEEYKFEEYEHPGFVFVPLIEKE